MIVSKPHWDTVFVVMTSLHVSRKPVADVTLSDLLKTQKLIYHP